jgi:hypothetical protein
MKPIIARTFLFLALQLVCLHAGSSDARITYEKALALEEASGRLSDAIALFQKVVAQSGSDETGAQGIFLDDGKNFNLSAVSPDGKVLALATTGSKWRISTVENLLPPVKNLTAGR